MRLIGILFCVSVLLASCNSNSGKTNKVKSTTDSAVQHLSVPVNHSSSDTLVITTKSVIFFTPNDAALQKWKAECADSEDYYTAMDDILYYRWVANKYIDSVTKIDHINSMEFQSDTFKFVCFVSQNNSTTVIKTDTMPDPYSVYFFDPAMPARLIDEVEVEEEYQHYFREHINKPALSLE